jgi:hypothetical protein
MNRNIFLLPLIIAIIGGGSILYAIGQSGWLLSWTLGALLGIYPFFFFYITRNLYYSKSGKVNSPLLWAIFIIKLVLTVSIILFIGTLGFIIYLPFIIGFLIMAPIVITIILIDTLRDKKNLIPYGK